MEELLKLLHINPSPKDDGKAFVKIICGVAFEPRGVNESWGLYWRLDLPQIPFYWRSTKGYRLGANSSQTMFFYGFSYEDVISRAVEFLKNISQEVMLEH